MARVDRERLHKVLLTICPNVYYQPTENVKLVYPCIIYELSGINKTCADDINYLNSTSYRLTVIDRQPDSPISDAVINLPWCSFNTHFVNDNLHHDVFTIQII